MQAGRLCVQIRAIFQTRLRQAASTLGTKPIITAITQSYLGALSLVPTLPTFLPPG